MISILEFYDEHGTYTQPQYSDSYRQKKRHNKFIRNRGRGIGKLTKSVDTKQVRGHFSERPGFGRRKGIKHFTNKFNNWRRQRVLAKISNRKRKPMNFPKMGPGDKNNIAWDALDGVF